MPNVHRPDTIRCRDFAVFAKKMKWQFAFCRWLLEKCICRKPFYSFIPNWEKIIFPCFVFCTICRDLLCFSLFRCRSEKTKDTKNRHWQCSKMGQSSVGRSVGLPRKREPLIKFFFSLLCTLPHSSDMHDLIQIQLLRLRL